jgi:glycosyltransferase involved in cell wall biosynthesis
MQAIVPESVSGTPPQVLPRATRVVFVSNFVPHYRIGMFEALAEMCDLDCYFYSDGGEWYWQRAQGVNRGNFRCEYLSGFWLGRVRIAPRLVTALLAGSHDVFIKCINDRFAVPVTYLAARLHGAPFVLWTGVWCRLTTPLQRLLFPLTRHLYRNADAIVAYGGHVRRYLISEGVEPDRIFLAPQAVDSAHYRQAVPESVQEELRKSLGITAGKKLLLYVGRLEPVKGLEYLLDGLALCGRSDGVLALCGTGTLESALRRRAERLGIADRVLFTGRVPTADTVRYYSIAWAVMLPSVTTPGGRETWGLVANEAFNQGVPLIASDAVGAVAGGLVRHLHTGLVTPERDPAALGAAIDRVLSDTALRNEMGENARREIVGWTQTRMAQGFRDAASFALDRRRRARYESE